MPTDLYKTVLFNDGEGIAHSDFNNLGRYLEARIFDQLIRNTIANARSGPNMDPTQRIFPTSTPFMYALHGGAGYIVPGASARQITIRAGTVFQGPAIASGDAASFIPYSFEDGDFTLTCAAADATNPRIDVVEMKLEYVDGNSESRDFEDATTELVTTTTPNKKRRVQATIQIKQGTPAATPAYPSLTSGFFALGAVEVPATYNAVFVAKTHMRDLRIPIGVKTVDVFPSDFVPGDATGWSHSQATTLGTKVARFTLGSSDTSSFAIPCPLPGTARIVGLALYGRFQFSSCSVKLYKQQLVDPGSSTSHPETAINTEIADLSSVLGGSSNAWKWQFWDMNTLEAALSAGPSPTRNAETLGDGIWGNGLYAGPSYEERAVTFNGTYAGSVHRLVADVEMTTGGSDNSNVLFARWFYADGL